MFLTATSMDGTMVLTGYQPRIVFQEVLHLIVDSEKSILTDDLGDFAQFLQTYASITGYLK
jgi:hypothetical protein